MRPHAPRGASAETAAPCPGPATTPVRPMHLAPDKNAGNKTHGGGGAGTAAEKNRNNRNNETSARTAAGATAQAAQACTRRLLRSLLARGSTGQKQHRDAACRRTTACRLLAMQQGRAGRLPPRLGGGGEGGKADALLSCFRGIAWLRLAFGGWVGTTHRTGSRRLPDNNSSVPGDAGRRPTPPGKRQREKNNAPHTALVSLGTRRAGSRV
jgi:hypothetical protein